MCSIYLKKMTWKPKFCKNVKNIKIKQIRNDYSNISIKIRPSATFPRKVKKIVSKLHSGTAIENVKK